MRTKKPLEIFFKWGKEMFWYDGNNVTNVKYKPNQNCHDESPPIEGIYQKKIPNFKDLKV
jgi:hypothetical protein